MKKRINPEMVILARESRGITQKELAALIGTSQAAVSKAEKFEHKVSESMLAQVSNALGYPEHFFYQNEYRFPPTTPLHRKKQSLPQKVKNRIEAEANIMRLHLGKLLDSIELPGGGHSIYDLDEFGTPANVAKALRQQLKVPRGPIGNITTLIENLGVVIFLCDFGTDKLDGFTIIGDENPIIFINKDMPWCRSRFTLAHELGHIVLGHVQKQGIEEEANEFASEFLMPEDDIRRDFNGEKIDLRLLAMLKPRWKVSMQALLMRARSLKYLSDNQNTYLWMNFSRFGYKRREPPHLDIPVEPPKLFKSIVDLHYNELDYSQEELMDTLHSTEHSFNSLYSFAIEEKKKKAKIAYLFS